MLKSELDERTREWLKGDKCAKVIIKKCPKCGLWYSEDLGHECEVGTSDVEAALGKWMPVENGLPEAYVSVLVTCRDGDVCWLDTARYEGGRWSLRVIPLIGRVVAWMPLPEPYREEETT